MSQEFDGEQKGEHLREQSSRSVQKVRSFRAKTSLLGGICIYSLLEHFYIDAWKGGPICPFLRRIVFPAERSLLQRRVACSLDNDSLATILFTALKVQSVQSIGGSVTPSRDGTHNLFPGNQQIL